MENIYNLDDFSSEKENVNETLEKSDVPNINNTNEKISPLNDLALMKALSAEKPKISSNNQLSKINSYNYSNDSYDLSLKLK